MDQAAFLSSFKQKSLLDMKSNEAAFSDIFSSYYKRVYNYVGYRVQEHHIAEDLTSQVFEKIYVKLESYNEEKSPFEVWMFAIARNTINDYYRQLKRRQYLSLDGFKDLISRDVTPENHILKAETSTALRIAVSALKMKERNIIAMKYGADLKNKEIAAILDISESSVGVLLHRSIKKLRKEMEGGAEDA